MYSTLQRYLFETEDNKDDFITLSECVGCRRSQLKTNRIGDQVKFLFPVPVHAVAM